MTAEDIEKAKGIIPTEPQPPRIKRMHDHSGKQYAFINGTLCSVLKQERMSKKERLKRRKLLKDQDKSK